MPPAARITDIVTCPVGVGAIIPPCAITVITGMMIQARMTDQAVCSTLGFDAILKGSPTVLVCNLMAARIGDPTAHGGLVTTGFPQVMIGEVGSPSPFTLDTGMGRVSSAMSEVRQIKANVGVDGTRKNTPQQNALADAAAEGIPTVEKCPYADH